MTDARNITRTEFEESHVLTKLRRMVIAARIWESQEEISSILYDVRTFDLTDQNIYRQVRDDYDLVRRVIIDRGFSALSGRMGVYIQPRTKGSGHGSTSRAFYARASFLKKLFLDDKATG